MEMSSAARLPKAVVWNKVFCWSMAVTNIALTIGLIWVIQNLDWLFTLLMNDVPADMPEYKMAKDTLTGTLFLACLSGAVFAALNAWLAHTRETAAMYYIHLCNLLVGLTTCVCIPFAVPLLIAWFKPEVKAHFQIETSKPRRSGR